jgi:hypothetical protein
LGAIARPIGCKMSDMPQRLLGESVSIGRISRALSHDIENNIGELLAAARVKLAVRGA